MGPFCRAASDCALIMDALRGRDLEDVGSRDLPLGNPFAVNISRLTVGVLPSVQESSAEVCTRPTLWQLSSHVRWTATVTSFAFAWVCQILCQSPPWKPNLVLAACA